MIKVVKIKVEHKKTYYQRELNTSEGHLMIEGPIHAEQLERYEFHEDLVAFRPASQQHQALVEIAKLPEGRIIIAREGQMVIG